MPDVYNTEGFGSDGGAGGAQFGRENEPHIYVKQYSSGPDTKKKKKIVIKLSGRPGSISCFHKKKKKHTATRQEPLKFPLRPSATLKCL